MDTSSPSLSTFPPHELLGTFTNFNLYACPVSNPEDQTGILKIARTVVQNSDLDREAFILAELNKVSKALEDKFGQGAGKNPLNYHLVFPQLAASFIAKEQGGRRVNILHFPYLAKKRNELVPVSNIWLLDDSRIDPRTSAWILGKFLKTLIFTHDTGITIGNLDGSNLIIHPKNHLVAIFDWSQATIENGSVSSETVKKEISEVARAIFRALNGNLEERTLPENDQLTDDQYVRFLIRLIEGKYSSARGAHKDFYNLIENIWPKAYHPYTAIPL